MSYTVFLIYRLSFIGWKSTRDGAEKTVYEREQTTKTYRLSQKKVYVVDEIVLTSY